MRNVQPEGWKRPSGYANGLLAEGKLLFVAGQIGWDPATAQIDTDDFVTQFARALDNVLAVVRAAGGMREHVARLTIYVVDKQVYRARLKEAGQVYRERFGSHYPTMALVEVRGLLEDRAQVEIEATAVIS